MKQIPITLYLDERVRNALSMYYEGTIEGYLESQIDSLFDEVVPSDVHELIVKDMAIESKATSEDKFSLIAISDGNDTIYFSSDGCKTIKDFGESFMSGIIEDNSYNCDLVYYQSAFVDTETLGKKNFDVLCSAMNSNDCISFVAKIDMKNKIVSVMENGYSQFTDYAFHCFADSIVTTNNMNIHYFEAQNKALHEMLEECAMNPNEDISEELLPQ